MVNMSKRYAEEDSDDERNDSSDEDDGNFKRRRRHSSGEDFVAKSLQSLNPEPSKPLKVIDSRVEKQLIEQQKVVNKKLSTLPTYDDLFDNPSEDFVQNTSGNSSEQLSVNNVAIDSGRPSTHSSNGVSKFETKVEVSTDVLPPNESEDVSKTMSMDPRLRRAEKFNVTPKGTLSGHSLVMRISELLNSRKPNDAYNQLKAEVTPLELHKHSDLMLVMAKDWFPSKIDTAYDPRDLRIEFPYLVRFADLMKDIFSIKTKNKEFWESIIFSIEKFIEETRIKTLPQLLSKLRHILINDIRDYLISEEVRIGLKANNILLDHKIKADIERQRHRRQFEASQAYMPRVQPTPAPPPVPVIIGCPKVPSMPPPSDPRSDPRIDSSLDDLIISPFQSTSALFPSNENQSERKTINQILECLTTDQYSKLTKMLDRHTQSNQNSTFIENIGQAMRQFVEKHPKFSVFTIYQKLHDSILLDGNMSYKGKNIKLNDMFEKLLKEFHETVIYNPTEYIQIRDHTRTEKFSEHFRLNHNPFNEPIVPVLHNVIIDCGYISVGIKVNYTAIEEEIPLLAQNIILKDPRMELRAEAMVNCHEIVDLDESVVGVFSPVRSDTSLSPEYSFSGAAPYSDSNSDANSDIIDSPSEPHSAIEEPISPTNIEPTLQKTENANPVRKVLTAKPKVVKKGLKKVTPLKNKLNNKTNSNKTVLKPKTINKTNKQNVNKSPINGAIHPKAPKPQNVIKITPNVEPTVVSSVPKSESPVKPQNSSVSATISPKSMNLMDSSTGVHNNCNTSFATLPVSQPSKTVSTEKRIIRLSKYNESELKSIIRRVSISSDESESD